MAHVIMSGSNQRVFLKFFFGVILSLLVLPSLAQQVIDDDAVRVEVASAACDNMGFESGTFDEWQGFIGCANLSYLYQGGAYYKNCKYSANCCPMPGIVSRGIDVPVTDSVSRHTLLTSAMGQDSCGEFDIVPPGAGNYVARVGNANVWGEAERLVMSYVVDPTSSILIYRYAVVIEEPIAEDHTIDETPYFEVILMDQNGDTIPCGYLFSYAGDGADGFQRSQVCTTYYTAGPNNGQIRSIPQYRPWSTVAVDLTPYIGTTVTLRVTTSDCARSGHYGYGYIDAQCAGYEPINDTLCAGKSTSFSAPGDTMIYTYSWTGPGGFTANTQTITGITQGGDYTVDMTGSIGCMTSLTYHLEVMPNPVADFSTAGVCTKTFPFADNSTINGSSIVSWDWDFGDGNTSTSQNPTHTYANGGSYNTTLIVTSAGGCKDTIIQQVDISEVPTADFNSTPVCLGAVTTFINSSTPPVGGTIDSYNWDFGDGGTSTDETPTHSYTTAGEFDVTLIVTSASCSDTIVKKAIVYPQPDASFIATNPCVGDPTSFTNRSTHSSTLGDVIDSYNWDFGDGGTSTDEHPTHTYTAAGTYNVTLTVTTDMGCFDTITKTVYVNEIPVADFTVPNVCLGEQTCFTDASTVTPGVIDCWKWDFGDGTTSTDQNPCHTYAAAGTYTVTLTVCAGECENTTTGTTEVYPFPTADFSPNPQTASVFDPVISFRSLSSGADSSHCYSITGINFDTCTTQDAVFDVTFPNDNVPGGASYDVTLSVINQYGCPDEITKPVYIEPYWTFYIPNAFTPNGDGTNDTFFGKGVGILEYEFWIFDRWGNRVFHCDIDDLPQHPMCHWDGKHMYGTSDLVAQQDVYVWLVLLTDIFGDKHRYIGHVSMVR